VSDVDRCATVARISEQVLELAAVEGVVKYCREPSPHLGLIAVANGLDEQIAQRVSLELEFAKHVEHLSPECLARLFEFLQKLAIDITLARFIGDKVPEMAHLGLAYTIVLVLPLEVEM
jgi:hypothetical protein